MKKRTIRRISTAAVVVLIGGFLIGYALNPGTPPKDFLETRIQTVGAANNLAQLVSNSLANLDKVETYTKNENDIEALTLIKFEFSQSGEKQAAAVRLAAQLDQMAKTVPSIASSRARSAATEAVTSGIAMVTRIISYNSDLDRLFQAIQQKIQTGKVPDGVNPRLLAANLNSDAKSINDSSKEFNDALARFDSIYGIK